LRARLTEIKARLAEIDSEYAGRSIKGTPAEQEWDTLNAERDEVAATVDELEVRAARLAELAAEPTSHERGAHFHSARPGAVRGNDIYDLSTVRANFADLDAATGELRDRGMRAVEQSVIPHPDADQAKCKEAMERLLNREDGGVVARRILTTCSPAYKRAFAKAFAGAHLTPEEMRALTVGTAAEGGFAVPATLDPTIIPTSNGTVNPMRAISRVEQITTDTWQGVTAGGITANRRAEAAESTDNAPTLAQPEITPTRVDVFIPFSIEVGQDWSALQSEMAVLIQDAKDDEEAASFVTGVGTASFAVANLYSLEEALAPRFRARAQVIGNRAQYNRVRQFDTQGGASIWTPSLRDGLANNPVGNTGYDLLGYPANEASAMASVLTAGSALLVIGDFRYYIIVDRIGMSIDLIPHLFGASGRPTGQRGLFAFWRNSGKVASAAAFKKLVTT
jgi:HK97 family phage major capsid protein